MLKKCLDTAGFGNPLSLKVVMSVSLSIKNVIVLIEFHIIYTMEIYQMKKSYVINAPHPIPLPGQTVS